MNIFFHANLTAIQDYNYNFKVGEYWRLPPRVHSIFTQTDEEHSIKLKNDFSYEVCATVRHIVKKTVRSEVVNTGEIHENHYGLIIFEMNKSNDLESMNLTFFMELDDHADMSVDKQLQEFFEGKKYKANVEFFLTFGPIESIVNGLWDQLYTGYGRATPFSIFQIKNIYDEGKSITDINDLQTTNLLIETNLIWYDELIGKSLDYYTVDSKLEVKYIGDWSFGFMHLYMGDYPELIAHAGTKHRFITKVSESLEIVKVVELMKQNIWLDDYDEAISISFEDVCISFIKLDMPKVGWDEEYEEDLEDVNILVRYTDPWTNNISTLSNLKEIEEFAKWYEDTYYKYKAIIDVAKKDGYKFTWK
jgi:hypothetical protein